MVLLSATAATAVGLLYPQVVGGREEPPDGSKVMRCVAVFVGIYQASTVSLHHYGNSTAELYNGCYGKYLCFQVCDGCLALGGIVL